MSDHATSDNSGTTTASQRPRLVLKPRNEEAARKAELERQQKSQKANPFGNAKPREAILAQRTGKTEEEILREAVKADRAKLPLNEQQAEEKIAAEEAVQEIQAQLEQEVEASQKKLLEEELKRREAALDELWEGFEKLHLDAVAKGEISRPSERRSQLTKPDADNARDTYRPRPSQQGFSSSLSYNNGSSFERRSQPSWDGGHNRKHGFSDVRDKDVGRQSDHSYRSINFNSGNNFNTNNSYRTNNRSYDDNGRSNQSSYGGGDSRIPRGYTHNFDDRGRNAEYISRGQYGGEDFGSAYGTAHERRGAPRTTDTYPQREAAPIGGKAYSSRTNDEAYTDYPGMGPPIQL